MPKLVLPAVRREAYIFIILSALIAAVIGTLTTLFARIAGYSILLGVLVWLIPNILFAYRIFSNVSVRAANKIVRTFYLFEALKLALTVIFFIAAIKIFTVNLGFVLLGYMLAWLLFSMMVLLKVK